MKTGWEYPGREHVHEDKGHEVKTIETDVLIIGGGPAGTSTALSLLNYSDLDTVLIEQSDLSGHRIGENVSASIFDLLKYLKVNEQDWDSDWITRTHSTVSVWGSPHPVTVDSILSSARSSYQIDREVLDFALLQSVAERGGNVLPRTRYTRINRTENLLWATEINHATKGKLTVKSKFLVDATGRKASVCKHLRAPIRKLDTLMGVGIFTRESETTDNANVQCIEATETGWWYSSHLPKGNRVITVFSDADIISRERINVLEPWIDHLSRTIEIKKWCSAKKSLTGSTIWVKDAASQISDTSGIKNFLAVGDAACSFDPISSMGIGFAMTSAFHAANHIITQLSEHNQTTDTSGYQENIENHYSHYRKLRDQFYHQENRWNSSPFWSRRKH